MYRLPTKVTVDGLEFNIRERGDFRMVLDCFKALQDVELSEDYRVLASLLIFYNEFTDIEDLRELILSAIERLDNSGESTFLLCVLKETNDAIGTEMRTERHAAIDGNPRLQLRSKTCNSQTELGKVKCVVFHACIIQVFCVYKSIA